MKISYHLCLLCSLVFLSACAKEKEAAKNVPTPDQYTELPDQHENRNPHAPGTSKLPNFYKNKTPYDVVRVFYGTDRAPSGSQNPNK